MAGGLTTSCDSRHSDKLFVDEERKEKKEGKGELSTRLYTLVPLACKVTW